MHCLQRMPSKLHDNAYVKSTSMHIIKPKKCAMQVKACGLKSGDTTIDLCICSQYCDNTKAVILSEPFEYEGKTYYHSYQVSSIASTSVKTRPIAYFRG